MDRNFKEFTVDPFINIVRSFYTSINSSGIFTLLMKTVVGLLLVFFHLISPKSGP